MPSLPGGSPPKVALTTFPCRERYGHVWACLGDAILDLPALAALDQGAWQLAHGGPHDLRCGYRQLTENVAT